MVTQFITSLGLVRYGSILAGLWIMSFYMSAPFFAPFIASLKLNLAMLLY